MAGDENPAGALTGELTAVSILDAQGVPSMSYFLTPPGGGSPVRLLFASDPNLTSSTRLRVWASPTETASASSDRWCCPARPATTPGWCGAR